MDWKDENTRSVSRRKFIKILGGLALGVAVGGGGLGYATKVEPGWLDLTPVELALPRLDPAFAGFRIAQISDIHLSEVITAAEVSEAVDMALKWKPDLVALTGDYINFSDQLQRKVEDLSYALRPLVQSAQTVAVLGNHDYRVNARAVRRMLVGLNVQELSNRSVTVSRGSARLHIAGVDDVLWGRPNLKQVLSALPEDGAAILLAHEPDYADVTALSKRFDLQISGHTHGGQVVLPLLGQLILPDLGRRYPSGLYQLKNLFQYTNRGLGMVDPYVRFNCRPEITIFTLQPQKDL